MSNPEETGKYRVENPQPVQGQFIGDYTTVHYHPPVQPAPLKGLQRRKKYRWAIVGSVIACIIILVGASFFFIFLHVQTSTDPYLHQGHLVLDDPLTSNNKNEWNVVPGNPINGKPIDSCDFTAQSYQVILQAQSTYQTFYCWNHMLFLQNFVYQITIHLVTNTGGGLIFRLDANTGHFFYFGINPYGQYTLAEAMGGTFKYWKQDINTNAIHRGLEQTNILAIAAEGDQIRMYINKQAITPVPINTNNNDKGYIGVAVGNDSTTHISGQANYTDAEVWSLDQ